MDRAETAARIAELIAPFNTAANAEKAYTFFTTFSARRRMTEMSADQGIDTTDRQVPLCSCLALDRQETATLKRFH